MKKNIIANFIGRFWSILSNFLFIPLYIHYLGFESYSIISFTLVITGLMAVLDAGLTATLSREFARLDNSHNDKIQIFKTLETTYFIVVAICIVVLYVFSEKIAINWLNINTIGTERVSFFFKIISFDIGFQLLLRFYTGGLLGLEKQVKANIYNSGWGIFRNGLVVFVIMLVPTLEMFFIWQTISTLIFVLLFRILLYKQLLGSYNFEFDFKINKKVFKKVWRFAGGMLLISLVAALNTQMDKIAISKFLPIESLGYYTLAVSIAMGIIVVINPISIALLPRFTALYSLGKNKEGSELFHKINLFVAIFVFSLMANFSFFSKELIWIWTGDIKLAESAFIYLPILAFAFSMLALQIMPYNISIANGYTKLNNILGLLSLVITIPGYWFATKNFGATGAAVVFCVVQFLISLIYIYIINQKFLKVENTSSLYLKEMLFPFVISCGIVFILNFIPIPLFQNRVGSFIWIGFVTLITLGGTAIILVPKEEYVSIIRSLIRTKKGIV